MLEEVRILNQCSSSRSVGYSGDYQAQSLEVIPGDPDLAIQVTEKVGIDGFNWSASCSTILAKSLAPQLPRFIDWCSLKVRYPNVP